MQIFVLVVIPSAVPYIVTGMRVAMASSFMSIIPAEILAADSGIGYLLQKSSLLLQTNRIFVALLTICILGFAVDRLFRFFVDRVLDPLHVLHLGHLIAHKESQMSISHGCSRPRSASRSRSARCRRRRSRRRSR